MKKGAVEYTEVHKFVQPCLRQPTEQCTPRAAPDRRMPVGTQLYDDSV